MNTAILPRSTRCAALAPSLLVCALALCPLLSAGAQTGKRRARTPESATSASIEPGDDFFGYVNAAWLARITIPVGKQRWGARDAINEVTRKRVATLLDGASTRPRGSSARKAADFRAAYLARAAIESKGLAPLASLLDSIDRIRDRDGLTRYLGRELGADVDPLNYGVYESSHVLGLSVEPSIHGEKSYVAFLVQGGLGLPDREYYIGAGVANESLRASYMEYIRQLLSLSGSDRADRRAAVVLSLETAMAHSQGTHEASAVDRNADNVWTRPDFDRLAPGMDWSAYFNAAGLSGQSTFVAWQPTAITGVAALVASQPVDSWKNYLRFHAIDRYAEVLPLRFAEPARALHSAAEGGSELSREQRAMDATKIAMSDALGRLYVEKYFSARQKTRVQMIVANVTAAFMRHVDAATWMSPGTKARALTKVKTLYVGIGYPDHIDDYHDLIVDAEDPIGNLRRVERRSYQRALAKVGRALDPTEWWMAPQSSGAILVFQRNTYDFSAALLQPPKFDPAASDAATYGAIGAIIGHDVTHYVDVLGAEYDTDGAMRRWWTADDSARYQRLVEPLAKQFSDYRPFPDAGVNGILTLTENVADLGGLTAAFEAYRRSLGARASDKRYVRRHDREFFEAFARSFRVKMSDAGLRAQLANDHAPEMYRVATVRNIGAWYDAFDVKPGQRLYLEPGARVRVW